MTNGSLTSTQDIAYRNLCDTCKSPATRKSYVKSLRYFMSYLRLGPDAYDKLLEKDTTTIQMDITDYIRSLRMDHSSGTISTYVAAIHKFFAMNDVQLNWTKIHSYEGEREKQTEDRPYTHDEIKLLVDRAKPRSRAIILLMASSGPRVGALPLVRIRDLEPIDKYGIYKITYYPKSRKSRYYSFCTPECRRAIDDYLDWRKRFGERLEPDTPLFRRDFNAAGDRTSYTKVKTIQVAAITKSIHNLLKSVGLRPNISLENNNNKRRRYEVMMDHGFRKFFETNAFRAGMGHIYIRRLLGQSSELEDEYLKTSEQDLLDGDSRHTGFAGIIDQMTIDPKNRLEREVETLRVEKNSWESLREEVEGLKALLNQGES